MVNMSSDISAYFLNEMDAMANDITQRKLECYDNYVNLTNVAINEGIKNQEFNHSEQMNLLIIDVLTKINYTNMLYNNHTIDELNRMILYDNDISCSLM